MDCIIDRCKKEAKTRGYCSSHYQEYRKSKNFQKIYRGRNICKVDGCGKLNWSHGYCSKHNYKIKKYGSPLGGVFYRKFERHGECSEREYRIYAGMLNRCYDINNRNYPSYGGRGIKICGRWLNGYKNFLEDMGRAPSGYSIDRINNDGNYEPLNCRWADLKTQANNTRFNVFMEHGGERLTITQWAEKLGINRRIFYAARHRGLDAEKILAANFQRNSDIR